ncbi:unnamed protein product [Calypogeia fissa]
MHLPKFAWVWWWWSVLLQAQLNTITGPRGGGGGGAVEGASLPVLKIGALLGINSSIGQVALASIQLAVQDVNVNTSILPNYELAVEALDSACDAFQGAASAVELLKDEVLAVVGPQTSSVAQFVVALGSATQVPIISFSATDPSLTKADNPYFLRTVHNSEVEMEVIASLIELYGWREVAAVSTNDYVGVDSLDALAEALYNLDIKNLYRTIMSPSADISDVINVLHDLALLEARVFVVHLQANLGRLFFNIAQALGMVTTGYVWLMTESMSSMLEDLPTTDSIWAATQGVVAVRSYISPSPELSSFQQRLHSQLGNSSSHGATIPSSLYGLYAYDIVWMIAQAMQTFLSSGHNFTFIPQNATAASRKGSSELASLNVLQEGNLFLKTIKAIQFVGVSGPVQVDNNGDLVGASYEILNLIGKSRRVVGYWSRDWGFSQLPSSSLNGTAAYTTVATQAPAALQDVIWPGGSAQIPRGWAVVKNGQKLRIGVPLKMGFPEFVDIQTDKFNVTTFDGFCIDVFRTAVSYLPYALNYTYVPYGNGTYTPNYNDLVEKVAEKEFDAVVGDVTITMDRSKIVDFTQPYTASGLVVVVPTKVGGSSHAWSFMRPFSPLMWVTTGLFFLFTGLAIWILEHKKNKDFRGNPKKQVVTVLWFIFSTLFFSQREKTKSTLGRGVLIIWLFVVLIVISSYTASLTSILTVQQLIPTIQGIAGLVSSNVNIGYQGGSFVQSYLEQMNVPATRLVPLSDQTAYVSALSKGIVGAIVDELPYIDVFLNTECQFTIAGQEFTKSGWGFAFPKGSQLVVDISTAILQMSENGRLQQIHDYWLNNQNCGSSGLTVSSNELGLDTFWGLFVITGTASILCVVIYYSRLIWQHHKSYKDDDEESDQSMSRSSHQKSFLRSLVTYIEEAEVSTRDDVVKANKCSRNTSRVRRKSLDSDMESTGGSARSDEPVLNAPRTPDHPISSS